MGVLWREGIPHLTVSTDRSQQRSSHSELESQVHVSCSTWVLGTEPGPMWGQHVLLNAKPSLQPSKSWENCCISYRKHRAKKHTNSAEQKCITTCISRESQSNAMLNHKKKKKHTLAVKSDESIKWMEEFPKLLRFLKFRTSWLWCYFAT